MMRGDYIQCAIHNVSVLPEDLDQHRTSECLLIFQSFRSVLRSKIRHPWVAKTITDRLGYKVYTPPRDRKSPPINNCPLGAITIDLHIPVLNLDEINNSQ